MIDINLVFEDNLYKVRLSGELTYNYSSISKVEEMFGVDMASYFADAIREACVNNGLVKRLTGQKSSNGTDYSKEIMIG